MKKWLVAAAVALVPVFALAQSMGTVNLPTGNGVNTPASVSRAINTALATKADANNGTLLNPTINGALSGTAINSLLNGYLLSSTAAQTYVPATNGTLTNPTINGGTVSSSTLGGWFNAACSSTIGQAWVRMTSGWGCTALGYANPVWWGATPGNNNTIPIQDALNAGAPAVFIPPGNFGADGLVMPATPGFTLFGSGTASVLTQTSGASPLISWPQNSVNYQEGYIRDLAFNGTNGGNNTIDTTGVGGQTLQNLYFTNVPVGYSSIYVNGAASTYVHDTRLLNIQIYSNTDGYAGLRFGPLSSDQSVTDFIMNGGFDVDYDIAMDVGADTLTINGGHPYNAKINVVNLAGNNNNIVFNGPTLDNAGQDIVSATNSADLSFTGGMIEAIPSGYSGILLNSTNVTSIFNVQMSGASGALAAVRETGTSNNTTVRGGNIGAIGNYADGPFVFVGSKSTANSIPGYNPLGISTFLGGATTTPQAEGTTMYLGVNGAQASATNSEWVLPNNGTLTTFYVATDNTPPTGQTYTFTVYLGNTAVGTLTIASGSYSGTATLNVAAGQYSTAYIESTYSATSGSANARYVIGFTQ
jgi:hypothetical protein